MYSITKRLPKLATLAVVSLLAACSADRVMTPAAVDLDPAMNIVAPQAPSVIRAQALNVPEAVNLPSGTGTFYAVSGNVTTYNFTVDPKKAQTFQFGQHMVTFPANTICDVKWADYGPSTWLQSCSKQIDKFSMVATTWTDANGRARIDFDRDIRFYPNSAGALPTIYLMDPSASLSAYSRIDYCHTATSCVDEAATDTVLRTQRDPVTGYLYRIIRHFSGYNVWA